MILCASFAGLFNGICADNDVAYKRQERTIDDKWLARPHQSAVSVGFVHPESFFCLCESEGHHRPCHVFYSCHVRRLPVYAGVGGNVAGFCPYDFGFVPFYARFCRHSRCLTGRKQERQMPDSSRKGAKFPKEMMKWFSCLLPSYNCAIQSYRSQFLTSVFCMDRFSNEKTVKFVT